MCSKFTIFTQVSSFLLLYIHYSRRKCQSASQCLVILMLQVFYCLYNYCDFANIVQLLLCFQVMVLENLRETYILCQFSCQQLLFYNLYSKYASFVSKSARLETDISNIFLLLSIIFAIFAVATLNINARLIKPILSSIASWSLM